MWDLQEIIRQNEIAHLQAVERANQKAQPALEVASAPIYPLAELARLLITGPPSLSYLIELVENSDVVALFHELVIEYLPEHEAFIMAQDTQGRIREFTYYFDRQYFPLSDNLYLGDLELEDFIRQIPVDLVGFSYNDYHEFNDFRDGYILMLALVESPYVDYDEGGRVPILERVGKLVGGRFLEMIPPEGWPLGDLHRLLDESAFAGVAAFADWVHANTGCWQLDASYEDYEGEDWSRRVVDQLTLQWPQVVEIQDKYQNMAVWLEEDLPGRFQELLDYMLGLKSFNVPKEQLPFPLDGTGQIIVKEVAAGGSC